VFEKWFAGSTGDPPVPSGDSPDGTGATVRANADRLFAKLLAAIPVGGSPTGAGGSLAPPNFKTGCLRGEEAVEGNLVPPSTTSLPDTEDPSAVGQAGAIQRKVSRSGLRIGISLRSSASLACSALKFSFLRFELRRALFEKQQPT